MNIQNICSLIPFKTVVFNQNHLCDYVNRKYSVLDGCYSYNEHWLYTTTTNRTGHDINKSKPVLRSLLSITDYSVSKITELLEGNDDKIKLWVTIFENIEFWRFESLKMFGTTPTSKGTLSILKRYPEHWELLRELHFDLDLLIDSGDALELNELSIEDYAMIMSINANY